MELRQYDKRPLTVSAFRFDAAFLGGPSLTGSRDVEAHGVRFRLTQGLWHVKNPGRPAGEQWQRIHHGDYVIIAPTGCRYPVQADQFERNYAEVVGR